MAAYHLEALRRQRVIDRKVEALTRMFILQVRIKVESRMLSSPSQYTVCLTKNVPT